MQFDLTDLALFVAIVEAASITHGADRVHLSLAAASARVRGMEEALGTPLLERGRRGIRPTPAGQALAGHARAVLRQVERMKGDLGEYARGLKGRVRLMANTVALAEFLPEVLAGFLADHPQIAIDVEERPSREIVAAVADGTADIGIASDAVDCGRLHTFPFRDDRLVVAVPPGHPLAGTADLPFRAIADQVTIGLGPNSALQTFIATQADRSMALRLCLPSLDAVCRAVARGGGLAVVPQSAARRFSPATGLCQLGLSDAWAMRRLRICVADPATLPAHARHLVACLRAPQA